MHVVDANVLLYAVNEDAHHHDAARGWLDGALNGEAAVGFAWVVLLAFLRLSTRRPATMALSAEQAVTVAAGWLARPNAVILTPTPRHLALMGGLLAEAGTAGNLVNDVHLAALALEHDADVVSFDGDFARLAGVRWRRPPG